jgi:hypothetical protein
MAALSRELRRLLESTVLKARQEAEEGARKALEQVAVQHHEPWGTMTPEERGLRNRLRAHGRQLGDSLDERRGTQAICRLTTECAYEHWHRMLFARFLAECGVLVEPGSGVAISLDECKELARAQRVDWLDLASSYAQRMLPEIFRSDDPLLALALPVEHRHALESLLSELPTSVFIADDSLGWVYQFWQSEEKNRVNASEKKIGSDELPAVTQLFTEDYMVRFLLENTLGAWWAGKYLAEHVNLASSAEDEDELREACSLDGYAWTYTRFIRDDAGIWRPAAGTFARWPRDAKDVTVLDPCMGSGHFLLFALQILAAIRRAEENLARTEAVVAVLRDNLFGVEIDPRCTQIAAFNLALSAWRTAGFSKLPTLNLACSGLGINAKESEWLALPGDDQTGRNGMKALYRLFGEAPTLGSLIDPARASGDLFAAGFSNLQSRLNEALAHELTTETTHELGVFAQGIAIAAGILARQFTLVATNVPYLGRGNQDSILREHCERYHPNAKNDLATCFVERSLALCQSGGSLAAVVPQNWFFLTTYSALRSQMLRLHAWDFVAKLGPGAFETITGERVDVALLGISREDSSTARVVSGWDVVDRETPGAKAAALCTAERLSRAQRDFLRNPDAVISFQDLESSSLLGRFASCYQGLSTGDSARLVLGHWELPGVGGRWREFQCPPETTCPCGGREYVVDWETLERGFESAAIRGREAWGKNGIAIGQMTGLPATLYSGSLFADSTPVIIPRDPAYLPAIWAFASSPCFNTELRKLNPKVSVNNGYVGKIHFDYSKWRNVADALLSTGLPRPYSSDPTQWLFDGQPRNADSPLHVAIARLVGYQWPRQTGSSFPDCPTLGPDGLESLADDDGIVCLNALRGEATAADRLLRLLAAAYRSDWSADTLNGLLGPVGYGGKSLDDWLRDGFFHQHCELFHQLPFVWHIWDGLKDGFAALVNYHRLAGPTGVGRRTLEKLIYAYLGDWLDRQKADQAAGVQGSDARLAAAQHLTRELERILEGPPPYDVFVRWKPLSEQPLGWEPDLNDGVRLNIRPFMAAKPLAAKSQYACILRVAPKIKWEKDRGKEPERPREDYPWFWGWDQKAVDFAGGRTCDGNRWNDVHLTREFKLAARQRKGAS